MSDLRVRFLGWHLFINSGEPYRSWRFEQPIVIDGIEYDAGAILYDAGPARTHLGWWRFSLSTHAQRLVWGSDSEKKASELLGLPLSPWPALPDLLGVAASSANATLRAISDILNAPVQPPEVDPERPLWIPTTWMGGYAAESIGGTRVRRGDAVLSNTARGYLCLPLSVPELELLRAAYDALRPLDPEYEGVIGGVLNDRKRWGRRRDGSYRPVLYIVRPVRPESVSAPLSAPSHDAAIFELLYDVGCRMPA